MRIEPTDQLPPGATVAYGEDQDGDGVMFVRFDLITEEGARAIGDTMTARDRYYQRVWPDGPRP